MVADPKKQFSSSSLIKSNYASSHLQCIATTQRGGQGRGGGEKRVKTKGKKKQEQV
jgi:hypothetical protein